MAYQQRCGTFRKAGLIGAAFAALIGGTGRDAYASPGCNAMKLSNESVEKYLATAKSLNDYLSHYRWTAFSKGDKITASVSTNMLYGKSYGSIVLIAFTNFPAGKVLVQPSYKSFTYVVPADTSDTFGLSFRDVSSGGDSGHFSIKCTNAGPTGSK